MASLRKFFSQQPQWLKFVFDMMIYLASVLIFLGIFVLGGYIIFHRNIFSNALTASSFMLHLSVAAQTLAVFFFPSLVVAAFYKNSFSYLKMDRLPDGTVILIVIVLALVAQLGVNFLAELNSKISFSGMEFTLKKLEKTADLITQRLLSGKTYADLLVNLFIVALLPAISEEMFFRGILQTRFVQMFKSIDLGVILAAFVFSFAHFEFFTFLPRFFLGLVLGYLFVYTESLWSNILLHFTNNAMGVILYFVTVRKGGNLSSLSSPHHVNYFLGIASIVIVIFLIVTIKKLKNLRA